MCWIVEGVREGWWDEGDELGVVEDLTASGVGKRPTFDTFHDYLSCGRKCKAAFTSHPAQPNHYHEAHITAGMAATSSLVINRLH